MLRRMRAKSMACGWVRARNVIGASPNAADARRRPASNFSPPSVTVTMHAEPAIGLARDIAAIDRILPDRQPRARSSPGLDHLGIKPRLSRDPFDEIEHQRVCRLGHRILPQSKASALLAIRRQQQPASVDDVIARHRRDQPRRPRCGIAGRSWLRASAAPAWCRSSTPRPRRRRAPDRASRPDR